MERQNFVHDCITQTLLGSVSKQSQKTLTTLRGRGFPRRNKIKNLPFFRWLGYSVLVWSRARPWRLCRPSSEEETYDEIPKNVAG